MTTTSFSQDALSETTSVTPANAWDGSYPLTPLQQGMLFQWMIDRHAGTDLEQIVGDLYEAIDPNRLHGAWDKTVAGFSTLRTAFRSDGLSEPRQHIEPTVSVPFRFEDLRAMSAEAREAHLKDFLEQDRKLGFDLAAPPVMRVCLFQLADAHFRIVWSVHHILIDGRSFEVVLNAVFDAYDGRHAAMIDRPYSDYTTWIAAQDQSESRKFWKEKLAGYSAPTPLPADLQRGAGAEKYQDRWLHLSAETTQRLREVAAREQVTLNTLVMSAWGLMLARYSGEKDIVFGATKTTRRGTIPDADSILGVFLATIPVRLKVSADMSVRAWLQHVREEWVALRGHEHLPLTEIRQASDVRTARLFDTLFVFENYQFGRRLNAQGGEWSSRHFGINEQTGFPLTLLGYGDDELALRLEFDSSRFSGAMIDFLMGHLSTLLLRWTEDVSVPLASVSMMTATEEHRVLREWNDTTREYPRDAFIDDLFAEQAALRPDAIAVECEGVAITYGALEMRATALAGRIVQAGVKPGECVGLFAERSINLIVACLAILKAGAAYVPFEPGYPKDRLRFMLGDANVRVVLTPEAFAEQFREYLTEVESPPDIVSIDAKGTGVEPAFDTSAEARAARLHRAGDAGARIAYVMYTSGSSGQPKGVAVPHRGAVRLVRNTTFMDFTSDDAMLGLATTMFDLSTWEFWSALLNGGRLVLLPGGPIDLAKVADLVQSARVTMMWNTPALFQQVVDYGLQKYGSVRLFAIAGDIVPVPHLRLAVAALPNCQFVNGYGPTENSVFTCAYRVPKGRDVEDPLPIGPPLTNSTVYVLDEQGSPTPVGVPGELFTGGDGVALRYLNRPELTAERFLPDPFSTRAGASMYRTGDGAKWRADGVVEFLGRLDNQVKIRGYRIEPGEIEAVMSTVPGVHIAAVTARKDAHGQKRLIGYFVSEEGKQLKPAYVRMAMRAQLPDYMVPGVIISMAELPQTNSGKIDRNALPDPSESDEETGEEVWRSRPLNNLQIQLAHIWEELLGRTSVGVEDDFFEMGGHSLLAVRMLREIERETGHRLALTTLLERPTIKHLARQIDLGILAGPEPAMVVLNAEGKSTPLAFVHGDLTGGGWYCRRLAKELGSDVPLIVLPTFRPPASGALSTIETMAAAHIRELRKVQPSGPYRVGGFCAGGLIALEIARALQAEGETIEQLVLVDSTNQNASVGFWRMFIDRMAPSSLDEATFRKRHALVNRAKYYQQRYRTIRGMSAGDLVRWSAHTVRIRLPGGRTAVAAPEAGAKAPTANVSGPQAEREKLLFYTRSASVYVPGPYNGSVHLVFSSDPLDKATTAPTPEAAAEVLSLGYSNVAQGWRSVFQKASVHHIPGTHLNLIVDNIGQLGTKLRELLTTTPS